MYRNPKTAGKKNFETNKLNSVEEYKVKMQKLVEYLDIQ